MAGYIEPIEKLIRQFTKLPGVGAKTAQRYALTVLSMTEEEAKADYLPDAASWKPKPTSRCVPSAETTPTKIPATSVKQGTVR